MTHFIEICKVCGRIISQCRCMSCDKVKKEGICDKCKEADSTRQETSQDSTQNTN